MTIQEMSTPTPLPVKQTPPPPLPDSLWLRAARHPLVWAADAA